MEQVYVGVATLACGNSSLPACSSCSTIDSISAAGRQAGMQAAGGAKHVYLQSWYIEFRVAAASNDTVQNYIYIYILFHTFLQSQFLHIPVEALLLASGSNVQSCSLT